MSGAPIRTLIVDDEHLARRRLRTLLGDHADFALVGEAEDGPEAVSAIAREQPDLVFLDVKMVEMDGLEVARAVTGQNTPLIVFVSAYDEFALDAFGVAALDYLLKPFDEERFTATLNRVRGQVAKNRGLAQSHRAYHCGDLEIDVDARIAKRNGTALVLRPKEFDLLLAFLKRPGVVVTKRELLEEVWGYSKDVMSRTIDTHLAELRRKLSPADDDPEYIETIARIGYRLNGGVTK
ncbi:MAG: winged helix-turn-helix domain-containing protein [Gemmatimonadaceae bacterium]